MEEKDIQTINGISRAHRWDRMCGLCVNASGDAVASICGTECNTCDVCCCPEPYLYVKPVKSRTMAGRVAGTKNDGSDNWKKPMGLLKAINQSGLGKHRVSAERVCEKCVPFDLTLLLLLSYVHTVVIIWT